MAESMDRSRRRLIDDFNAVVEDSEKLLKALGTAGAEKGSALRSSAEENLQAARERLKELQAEAFERSRAAAKATDEFVHENPWQSMGGVAVLSAVAGFVIGLMVSRR